MWSFWAESYWVLINFKDKPSARPTFVSAKVGKTIVIHKTCSYLAFILFFAETESCRYCAGCEWRFRVSNLG